MGTVKRIGIADCHGIAEYHDYDQPDISTKLTVLCLRASCNSHRRSVAFELEIAPKDDDTVMKLLRKGDYKLALKFLKSTAINVKASGANSMSEIYWREIPNPDLDPSFL